MKGKLLENSFDFAVEPEAREQLNPRAQKSQQESSSICANFVGSWVPRAKKRERWGTVGVARPSASGWPFETGLKCPETGRV